MPAEHQPVPFEVETSPRGGEVQLPLGARCPFEIAGIRIGAGTRPVSQTDLLVRPFVVLTEFSADAGAEHRILVIAPLGGGFPVLLRDLVIGLLPHADVAVSDWLDARYVPASQKRFGFDENVEAVVAMIRHLGPGLDVIAVCQGVIPALLASALVAADNPEAGPRSLVLIGGPVDPLANPTRVVQLLRARSLQWFQDNVMEMVPAGFPGQGRLVYPAKYQVMTFMGYLSRHMMSGGELLWKILRDDGEDPVRFPFLQLCLRLMDLPFEFFLENVQYVYHDRICCSGAARVLNRPVDLRALRRTRLMSIEGEQDDIAAPGQTKAVHDLCGSAGRSRDAHLLVPGCGHFSLFHGEAWRRRVLPEVVSFMLRRRGNPRPRGCVSGERYPRT